MKKLILSILLSLSVAFAFSQSLPNVATPSYFTSTGTAYVFNISGYGTAYNDKIAFVKFLIDNTGPATVNINGIGAKQLRIKAGGVWRSLIAGDLTDSARCFIAYDQASGYIRVVDMFREGGGSSTFTSLTDGPGSFTGKSLNFVRVNTGETALEYQTPSQVRTDIGAGTGNGTVTSVTSATADATVATTTTTPVITIVSAPKLTTPRTIGIITGDGTSSGSSFDGSANNTNAFTLATVNSNTGSFGSSTSIPTFTVNAKGLITAASGNAVIAPAGTLTGTTLNSTVVNSSLTSVGTIATGTWQGTAIADSYISSAAAWNAKVSSQWVTTGSDIYYNTGNVMIGTNAAPSSKFHIVETSTSTPRGILADQYSASGGSRITMRTASGTFASPTTVATGRALGSWTVSGYDGTNFLESAKILVTATGTVGTGNVPAKVELQTANSSGALTTGLTIDQSQNVTIAGTIGASNLSGTNTGDQTITLTGDVTGTGTGSFATTIGANKVVTSNIADANVTLAKMANVATSTVFYRKTAGTGAPEVQTLATLKTDLGLTGTNSGDQTITLTGDVTGSGTGSFATTLTNSAVTGQALTGYVSGSGTISATDNILQAIQKLNGNDAGKWSLASGGTLTGVNTITSNANSQINFGGTWTATGNSQYHVNIGGTLTSLTGNSTLYGTLINTAMTAGAASHTLSLLRLDGSNMSTTNSPTRYVLNALGSVLITTSSGTGASSLTINNSTGSVSTNFDVQNTGTSVFKVSSSGSVTFAPSTATTAAAYTFAGNAQTATSGAQNIFAISTGNKAGANSDVLTGINMTSTYDVNGKTGVNVADLDINTTISGTPANSYGILVRSSTKTNGFGTATPGERVEVNGNIKANHLVGRTSAPTIAAGTGAGTSPTVIVTNATDMSGIIDVTTGTSPAGSNATIATITFNTAYGAAPNILLTPNNANAAGLSAALTMVYCTSTTTTFLIVSGTTGLAASTQYKWFYQVTQ